MKLVRVLDNGISQHLGQDDLGKPLFVLCHLMETSAEDRPASKDRDMKTIVALSIGTKFWVRTDAKTQTTDPFDKAESAPHTVYKSVTVNAVVSRFNKDATLRTRIKLINKRLGAGLSSCRKFKLCEIIAKT